MQRVFVYGSLKRGFRHHDQMAGARFLGEARTARRYTLVVAGDYPALVDGGATAVAGELFAVDDPLLAALDAFEEVPELYVRAPLELEGGERVLAYFLPAERACDLAAIADGTWRER